MIKFLVNPHLDYRLQHLMVVSYSAVKIDSKEGPHNKGGPKLLTLKRRALQHSGNGFEFMFEHF